MSYTYHGATGLVTLPDREVQTFPSGLVRVTRSYVCRKGTEGSHRRALQVGSPLPDDSGAPAIDGLYIFPEPQEITRDDGFVEFRVTAYGRTSTGDEGFNIEQTTVRGSYDIVDRRPDVGIIVSNIPSIKGIYIIRAVINQNAPIQDALTRPSVTPFVIPISGITPLQAGSVDGRQTRLGLYLDSYNSTNYGLWQEIVVSWVSYAEVTITSG